VRPIAYLAFNTPELRDILGRCGQIPGFSDLSLQDWMCCLAQTGSTVARDMMDAIVSIRV
jgi:hypothetical protein